MRLLSLSILALALRAEEPVSFPAIPAEQLREWMSRSPAKNAERLTGLRTLFTEAGCPELREQKVRGSKLPNLICRVPGETAETIVVGAHFDKVKAGRGVIDNWTGATLLAALEFAMNGAKPKRTLLFVGFTDEELGLVGSRAFARQIPKAELGNYRAMINLDSLGAGPLVLWVSHADRELANLAVRVAGKLGQKITGVNIENVGDGDSSSFRQRKIPIIDFHSLTQENFRLLHTDDDNESAFHADDFDRAYRFLVTYVGFLAHYWKPEAR